VLEVKRRHALTRVALGALGNNDSGEQQVEEVTMNHFYLDSNVPSFVYICQELLRRQYHQEQDSIMTQFIFHESQHVCNMQDSFHALSLIILSSIVAQAGSSLRILYRHDCSPNHHLNEATIQQFLPTTLSFAKGIGIEVVVERCNACLGLEGNDFKDMISCFGFPVIHESKDPTGAAAMLAPFRHNLQWAVERVIEKMEDISVPQSFPSNPEVVVYLGTDTEMGETAYVMPLSYFMEIIPRHVSSISIIMPSHCHKCVDVGSILFEYFQLIHPSSRISSEIVSGSAIAYAHIMKANTLICSPSIICVLPTMFQHFPQISHIILQTLLYPWFPILANQRPNGIAIHENIPVHELNLLSHDSSWKEETKNFLLQAVNNPLSSHCLSLRGRLGVWIPDLQFAQHAQYISPLKRFQGFNFTPTSDMPFRLATIYRWVDALCPVYVMEREHFCRSLSALGLTHVYFVGDSLGMQMAQSLWKLLGNEDDPYRGRAERFQWKRSVDCSMFYDDASSPPSEFRGFDIVYTRNDILNNHSLDPQNGRGTNTMKCGIAGFCVPWISKFQGDVSSKGTGSALLVVNLGTHVHNIDDYREYLDSFLESLQAIYKNQEHQHRKDLIFFRTTPPGHANCQRQSVAPLRSYREYLTHHFVEDSKSYHMFPLYNALTEERILSLRDTIKVKILSLDVVPMTVLRPDGHTSGPQKCSTCKDDDCLHYMLPGPPDWWNHLMFSQLETLAALSSAANAP
jgi:GDSL/SGNH-like Acyl-Esterase family found in Pmr5 and Cas1p